MAKSMESLEERLKFETLLAEISARFINIPADRMDREIERAQKKICEFLKVDRSTLWQVQKENPGTLLLTHIHQPSDSPPPPAQMNAKVFFPWSERKVLGGDLVVITKITDLPKEAVVDLESFQLYGTKSNVLVPLSVGGDPVFGLLTFAMMRDETSWPETVVKGFRLIADVFANALSRRQTEKNLCESEARLNLATDAAGAGLWSMAVDSGAVWVSKKTRDLFHFAPTEELKYESFLEAIHPEDRDQVHKAVQDAIRTGDKLLCDFRITLPDGNIRWIAARGKRQIDASGKPECLVGVFLDITKRKGMEDQLRGQVREIEDLRQRLERENLYLQEEVKLLFEHSGIVGNSSAIKKILAQAEQVAGTDSTVLILGETGTGKELLARAIHQMSRREGRPLITVNCASLAPTLIESELFGREKGAYTGAMTKMIGRFELADGSSLFLDEIGEIPLEVQSKLLRILEVGRFERLGSTNSLQVDVRIIAATNRHIARDVSKGLFRKDLYYRLNVFPISIPPLRKRREDIPLLVWAFIREFEKKMGKRIDNIPRKTMEAMERYGWPGNVRELKNVIERGMIVSKSNTLDVPLPQPDFSEEPGASNLEYIEKRHVQSVLEKTNWRIGGKGGAAEALGLKRTTLQSLMKRLGIERPAT